MGILVREVKAIRRASKNSPSYTVVIMSIKTQITNYPSNKITTLKMNTTNQKTAKRVLKKYQGVARRRAAAQAYWRIKKLVPSIKSKENISKLDVVLEAISYIQSLQGNLEATLSSRQFY